MSDKYKNGKIYTIRCKNDDSLIYVGSTTQPLFKRWFQHKSKANEEKINSLLYQKIRETNVEDWYIELFENFPCNNKEELNKREGEIIREIGTVNKQIAGRTYKEYNDSNKDKRKENYNNNKDKILQKQKEYRLNNKDKIAERKKEYQQKNKEIIAKKRKEYLKQYYESNKEKIAERNNKEKKRNIIKNITKLKKHNNRIFFILLYYI